MNEKEQIKQDLEKIKEIKQQKKDLIRIKKETKSLINQKLKQIRQTNDINKKEKLQKEIKEILIKYNKNIYVNDSDILKLDFQKITDQNRELQVNLNYVGFVYYFWSASTMNFKIIGLYTLEPIFELMNTKEMYYLDKPTMITNDIPIYWIQKGIPFTIEVRIKEQLLTLNEEIFKNGYNADLIRAMVKSHHWINVYGKEKWSMKFISFILTIMLCEGLIIYIILQNVFSGSG